MSDLDILDASVFGNEYEAADAIWARVKEWAAKEGGLRALEVFREIDKDRNNTVTVEEFSNFLGSINVVGVSEEVVEATMASAPSKLTIIPNRRQPLFVARRLRR